jgi:phage tail sheath gpL-like
MSNVPFANIPSNLRVPLFYAEVNNSQANTNQQNQRALVIGQITSAGTAVANTPVISQGSGDAVVKGGIGSMLALMTAAYIGADSFGELWYLPLADADGSVAANGSILFTAAPTAVGVLSLYIAGTVVPFTVTAGETVAAMATGLVAAINAMGNLPVTAIVDSSVPAKVDITAKNAGLAGNDIDLRLNYQGTAGGEVMPAGLALTITAMTSGATNPTLTTGLANLLDMPFDFIVMPYTDTTSLNALQSFLNDTTGRWSWETQVYGHVFIAYRGTLSAQTTFGTVRNDQHASVMGFNDSPTPNWIWAAALAGAAAVSLRADPALPLQTLAIPGVLAPPLASRFNLGERNTLLFDGISTFDVAQDGTVSIENLITTYQMNSFDQPDDSYLEVETLFTLMYVLRDMRSIVTSKYARVKLAADGTRFAPGAAVVTPSMIKADLIAEFQALEYQGFVQNSAAFAQALVVQQNSSNPNRVDVLWPGALIDQLRIFAVLAQFRLM